MTNQNPYQSPEAEAKAATPWYRRGKVVAGMAFIALACVCVLATIVSMQSAFHILATSAGAPKPDDLATAISHSLIYSVPAVPLALVGLVLLVVGIRSR